MHIAPLSPFSPPSLLTLRLRFARNPNPPVFVLIFCVDFVSVCFALLHCFRCLFHFVHIRNHHSTVVSLYHKYTSFVISTPSCCSVFIHRKLSEYISLVLILGLCSNSSSQDHGVVPMKLPFFDPGCHQTSSFSLRYDE